MEDGVDTNALETPCPPGTQCVAPQVISRNEPPGPRRTRESLRPAVSALSVRPVTHFRIPLSPVLMLTRNTP